MHCPACGADVVQEAVYCHKCGERLDAAEPSREDRPADGMAEASAAEAAGTANEKFKQTAAARLETTEQEEDEAELWQGSYSGKAMVGTWLLSGLITVALLILAIWAAKPWLWWTVVIVLVGLWLYQLLKFCYRRLNVSYRFTNQRFIHQQGILRRVTNRIEVIDMDDIGCEQTVLERFVGTGTIRISSSDRTHPELLLAGIANVKEVAGRIDDTRREERRRRGLHIESI